tara:strand:- start:58 stop:315 length:258 start_codon:yes stop_codon:yes gene_type:complete
MIYVTIYVNITIFVVMDRINDESITEGECTSVRVTDENVEFEEWLYDNPEVVDRIEFREDGKRHTTARRLMNRDREFQLFSERYY